MQPFEPSEAKALPLKNLNNCLSCDAFVYISLAPNRPVLENELEKIYYTEVDGLQFYSKLVDIMRFKFSRMPSLATLPATGMEGHEWEKWWLEQHPNTHPDTEMAVYFYKKLK